MATLKHVTSYRFSKRIDVGTVKSVKSADGVRRPKFQTEFSIWAAPYTLEQSLKYKNEINTLKDTRQLAIRPNKQITYDHHVIYEDEEFKIINIQRHLTNKRTSYDLITLESTVSG